MLKKESSPTFTSKRGRVVKEGELECPEIMKIKMEIKCNRGQKNNRKKKSTKLRTGFSKR